jgi:aryl-alcohol dehydrogenase-like predicted oxidoreductase
MTPPTNLRKRLGNSTLQVTAIGLGSWAIGGAWRFGWGPQEDIESIATIHRAVDRGINWIDTAPVYGLGRSEEVVGRALSEMSPADRPYVFTKCSLVWDDQGTVSHNLAAASIRREVEASLRRLRVERIDLYQIHWPVWHASPPGHEQPGSIEEAWHTLSDLRREGKVAWIGVSNFDAAQMRQLLPIEAPTSLQPPYSLLRRDIEQDILPFCLQHNIGVITYSPMQSGLLSGKMTRERVRTLPDGDWRRGNRFYQEPLLTRALDLADTLQDIGDRHGRTAGEVAIAWTRRHPAITATIVGARRPEQIDELAGAGEFQVSDAEADELKQRVAAEVR